MSFLVDLRCALRSVVRDRIVSAAIIASLTLGLMASSSVFGLLYGVLLRPLPFEEPARLVRVQGFAPERGSAQGGISPPLFAVLGTADLEAFDGIAAVVADADLAFDVALGHGPPKRVRGAVVSAGLFELLGVAAVSGRIFRAEAGVEEEHAALVSEDLWRRLWGADPRAVGSTLRLSGRPFTVLGVVPGGRGYPAGVELWLTGPERAPLLRDLPLFVQADYDVVARLAPEASLAAANAELRAVYEAARSGYPDGFLAAPSVRAEPLQGSLAAGAHRPLVLLQAGVGAILLICCANAAGLLLVRSRSRSRELAIRSVVGAHPRHLMQQVGAEILLLLLAGGALGVAAGRWLTSVLAAVAPAEWLAYASTDGDAFTLAAGAALTAVAATGAGAVPLASALRPDLVRTVKLGGEPTGRGRLRFGRSVALMEIALVVSLVVGAGLMIRSLDALQDRDLGFSSRHVLTARVTLVESRFPDREARSRWIDRFAEKLTEEPGVAAVGASQFFFAADGVYRNTITARSVDGRRERIHRISGVGFVTSGYFDALEIPIVSGRAHDAHAVRRGVHEAVVSRSLARELWPDGRAVGERLELEGRWWEVVGVAGDVARPGIGAGEAPAVFLPRSLAMLETGQVTFLVRAVGDGTFTVDALRAALRAFDPGQAPGPIETLDERIDREHAPQRFASLLLGLASALAVLLAGIGIYGVVAYSVSLRALEIGTRRAIGATTARILFDVVTSSAGLGLVGTALGGVLALLFAHGLGALLYGVSWWDLSSWGIGLLVGVLVPVLASLGPAGRACRVDPAEALRTV